MVSSGLFFGRLRHLFVNPLRLSDRFVRGAANLRRGIAFLLENRSRDMSRLFVELIIKEVLSFQSIILRLPLFMHAALLARNEFVLAKPFVGCFYS